jgi:hypothetical protein
MSQPFVPRPASVLKRVVAEPSRRAAAMVSPTPARGFQVLQSSRAPAQLSLFLRPGAVDVK